MKKIAIGLFTLSVFLIACSGGGKESAESIAKKWCDLNSKVDKATSPDDKDKAEQARRDYEKSIEEKYKTDTAMRDAVMREVEKCEDASEGR